MLLKMSLYEHFNIKVSLGLFQVKLLRKSIYNIGCVRKKGIITLPRIPFCSEYLRSPLHYSALNKAGINNGNVNLIIYTY